MAVTAVLSLLCLYIGPISSALPVNLHLFLILSLMILLFPAHTNENPSLPALFSLSFSEK